MVRRDTDSHAWRPQTLRRVGDSTAVRWLARGGLAMRALTYLIIGVLAGGIALGIDGHASQAGAMASIAETDAGRVLLLIAGACLLGLAVWQFARIGWVDTPSAFRRSWRRMLAVVKAIGFAIAAVVAAAFAWGMTIADVRMLPVVGDLLLQTVGGALVVLTAGGIVIGIGVGAITRGIRLTFFDELEDAGMSERLHILAKVTGRIGYISKGFSFVLIGVLLVVAVLLVDPARIGGLDGALNRLADVPFGRVVLAAIAVGLMVNGLYLLLRTLFLPDHVD